MNEWFKAILGKNDRAKIGGPYDDMTDEEVKRHISDAFERGQEVALEVRKLITLRAKEYADKGLVIDATIIIFLSAWLTVDWAKSGVTKMRAKHDEDNPVVKLWEAMSVAFGTDGDGVAALHGWAKKNGLGLSK